MVEANKDVHLIDAPHYSYLKAFYHSFFSGLLYVDVAKRWKGYGFLYIFFVACLLSIPFSIKIIQTYDIYFKNNILEPINALPILYIQNGKVSFDKEMPYFIKDKAGNIVAIIDTTGKFTEFPSYLPKLTILITKNKLFYHPPPFRLYQNEAVEAPNKPYVHTFDKNMNEVFNGREWLHSSPMMQMRWLTEVLFYPVIVGALTSIYLVFILVLGSLGRIATSTFFQFKINYKTACRLMSVAMTPQLMLMILFLLLNWQAPGGGFLYIILVGLYFFYGVIYVKRSSQTVVHV